MHRHLQSERLQKNQCLKRVLWQGLEQDLVQRTHNFVQVASDAAQVSLKTPGYMQFAGSPSTKTSKCLLCLSED
jgi:hypothetical protein